MLHTTLRASLLLLLTPLGAGAAATGDPTNDAFEGGANCAGWSFNVTIPDVLEPTGGNPGGWLRNANVISFAPILTSGAGPSCFTGDWRAQGVDEVTVDARTDFASLTAVGRSFSLLLRDTKGTADPIDDDYAYFIGAQVPQPGQGWRSYSFPVPSQSTDPVPAGWSGGHAGDLENFRPGVTWSDVITNVDRVEFWWLNPSFFALIQTWDVGVDNVALHVSGGSMLRNGSGANPVGYAQVTPAALGTLWQSSIDIATPGALFSVLTIGTGPIAPIPLNGLVQGELLIAGPTIFQDIQAGSHAVPVPPNCGLLGQTLYTQASTFRPGVIELNNALDVVVVTP